MKTLTYEMEISFDETEVKEEALDYVMHTREKYIKWLEAKIENELGVENLHIKDLKLFVHEGEV